MSASTTTARAPGFRYYDLLVGGMVAVLLCSNLIGPAKVCTVTLPLLGALTFGAGNLFFPISYIFDDVLTEVYGYSRARRAIWAGFAGLAFASVMTFVIIGMSRVDPDGWCAIISSASSEAATMVAPAARASEQGSREGERSVMASSWKSGCAEPSGRRGACGDARARFRTGRRDRPETAVPR